MPTDQEAAQNNQCQVFWRIVGKFVEARLADPTLPYKTPFPYFGFSFFVTTAIGVDVNLLEDFDAVGVPEVELVLPGIISLKLRPKEDFWCGTRLVMTNPVLVEAILTEDERDDKGEWTTDEVLALVDKTIRHCLKK